MGQVGSNRAKKDAKAITKKSVQATKIERAKATGILSLHGCKLKRIPDDVFGIEKLNTLDLSNNELTEIPAAIGQLINLKTLKLDSNQLSSLPDLSALTKLTNLVLDNNKLATLQALPMGLTKLSARNNQLLALPPTLCCLSQLESVDVSQNQISSIPSAIASCSSLKELTLDDNRIAQLPDALAQCPKLKALVVRRNRLGPQSIAASILAASAVHIMQLEGNPMSKFDLEAMDGVDAFLLRRKELKDKELHGGLNTDVTLCGLD
ncbi:hypothetical protein SPRG_00215 [Saprolegnia parasitica CBS 223.65]|uniref:Leucine-rich repeat-containing protein 57 n=1 Tax=Saprolegnia parasitica (strain CBS 223.65) TaxID=695850 RepID=A0A067D9M8_SAPPC|nr:hypothetical protein SPRG_00215 [Saprolegnia parasitica CBS 223.65]KDO35366.1 hypothetical protein SPRG_00215 [Saprolegnia parasitica CBS 223.65]|eukprot:XP_012193712.1 hypothetical protein SPRG_00215 [Saprolegnia parasitica CBS 223.65]